jgi:hypothetical protein
MLYRYVVNRFHGDRMYTNSCISAIELNNDIAILACGFDPYGLDHHAVSMEKILSDRYFAYGGKASEIIMDLEDIQQAVGR